MRGAADAEHKFRNIELETAFAAYVLRKGPLLAAQISLEVFTVPVLRAACLVACESGTILPEDALVEELARRRLINIKEEKTTAAYIHKIYAYPISHLTAKGATVMAAQLTDLHASLNILQGIQKLAGLMSNGWDLNRARETLKDLLKEDRGGGSKNGGDWLDDYEERVAIVRDRAARAATGVAARMVPTGLPHVDEWLGGGILKDDGEFVTLIGRTGVGKSATMVNVGGHAFSCGFNVVYATGEMSKTSVQFRQDAFAAGVRGMAFRSGGLTEAEWKQWEKTIQLYRATHDNYFEVIAFPRHFTVETLEARIAEVEDEREAPVDIIILDYINIMEPAQGARGEWRSQADVVWDFKGYLKEHNEGTAGFTAGQIVDEAIEKEVLTLADAKYARAISETSPIVLGLVQTDDDELEKQLQLQVIKLREAPDVGRVVFLHPDLSVMRLSRAQSARSFKELGNDTSRVAKKKQKAKRSQHDEYVAQ